MAFVRVRDRATGKTKPMSQGMAQALRHKYEIISGSTVQDEQAGATLPVAEESPNVQPAAEKKTADVENEVDNELVTVRAQYEALYGEKPHGRLKAETLRKLIAEKAPKNEA